MEVKTNTNKMYLATLRGDFRKIVSQKDVEKFQQELLSALPGTVKTMGYICSCCKTDLSKTRSTFCPMCEDQVLKDKKDLNKRNKELTVVYTTEDAIRPYERRISTSPDGFIEYVTVTEVEPTADYIQAQSPISKGSPLDIFRRFLINFKNKSTKYE